MASIICMLEFHMYTTCILMNTGAAMSHAVSCIMGILGHEEKNIKNANESSIN